MPYASVLNEDFADGTLETGVTLIGSPATPSGTVLLSGGSQGIDIDGILTQAVLDDFELNIYGGTGGAPDYNTGVVYLANTQETAVVDYALWIVKAATGDATYSLRRAGVGTAVYTEVASFGLASDLDAGVVGTIRHAAGTWSFFIDDVQVGSDYVGSDDWTLSSNKMAFRLTSNSWEIDRIDFGTAGNAADTEAPTPDVAPSLNYDKHYPRVAMDFTDALTANVSTYAVILAHGSTAPTRAQVKAGTDASDADVGTGKKDSATVASGTLHYLDLTEADITRGTIYAFAEDTEATPNQTTLYTIDKPALDSAAESGDETLILTTAVENLQSQSNGVAVFGLSQAGLESLDDRQMRYTVLIHKIGAKYNSVLGDITDFDATGGAAERLVTVAMDHEGYTVANTDVVEVYVSRQSYQASFSDNSITAAKIASDAIAEIQSGISSQTSVDDIASDVTDILTDTGTTLDALIQAIKAKTDSLAFTNGAVDANMSRIGSTALDQSAAGTEADPFGPA